MQAIADQASIRPLNTDQELCEVMALRHRLMQRIRCLQHLARAPRKRRHNLNRVHLAGQLCQDRRLITGTRSDLEHAMPECDPQRFGHVRHDVRLRDRLPLSYRQRGVVVRPERQVRGNEPLARQLAHDAKKSRIGDLVRADLGFHHGGAPCCVVNHRRPLQASRYRSFTPDLAAPKWHKTELARLPNIPGSRARLRLLEREAGQERVWR